MASNNQDQKVKPAWVEPKVIQIDQLPTTFGACTKGKSETPGGTGCGMGKGAAPTCMNGARGARV